MNLSGLTIPSPVGILNDPVFDKAGIRVYIKRDDLIHPAISGNKWRKLAYNLKEAVRRKSDALISFGGAYSNHLYALAALGKMMGMRTIGVVRGEELHAGASPTLDFCASQGMELHFVPRDDYRQKEEGNYCKRLIDSLVHPYIIPEGGTNSLALSGVADMVAECRQAAIQADHYLVPAGTGGTAAGILSAGERVVAFSVLKGGGFLQEAIGRYLTGIINKGTLDMQLDYHFGGYARHTPELLRFIASFEKTHALLIEQVYTGKMFYGLYDLTKRGYFARGTTLVAVHTGGLQGKLKSKLE